MDPFLELFGAVAPFLREFQEGLPPAPDVEPQAPLSQEEQAQASSSHRAPDPEGRAVLETPELVSGIESHLEKGLRSYSQRPSVTKRFPRIDSQTLDFSNLAKQLAKDELDVGSKSTDELRDLFQKVRNIHNVQGIYDDLLRSLSEQPRP